MPDTNYLYHVRHHVILNFNFLYFTTAAGKKVCGSLVLFVPHQLWIIWIRVVLGVGLKFSLCHCLHSHHHCFHHSKNGIGAIVVIKSCQYLFLKLVLQLSYPLTVIDFSYNTSLIKHVFYCVELVELPHGVCSVGKCEYVTRTVATLRAFKLMRNKQDQATTDFFASRCCEMWKIKV